MKQHLAQTSPPSPSRFCYFPSAKVLRNMKAKARDHTRYSEIDQVSLKDRMPLPLEAKRLRYSNPFATEVNWKTESMAKAHKVPGL